MRNISWVLLAFTILVFQGAVMVAWPLVFFTPNLMLLLVVYLGVSPGVHLLRGAALSFVLGYLFDSFCGSPIGLQTFVLVATFLVARGAGLRFFMRGILFQVVLSFLVCLVAEGAVLGLRAIFDTPSPFPSEDHLRVVMLLVSGAVSTGICSPLVFRVARRLDLSFSHGREEGVPAL